MEPCLPSQNVLLRSIADLVGPPRSTWRIYLRSMDLVEDTQRFFITDLHLQLHELQKEGLLCSIPAKTVNDTTWMLTEKGIAQLG